MENVINCVCMRCNVVQSIVRSTLFDNSPWLFDCWLYSSTFVHFYSCSWWTMSLTSFTPLTHLALSFNCQTRSHNNTHNTYTHREKNFMIRIKTKRQTKNRTMTKIIRHPLASFYQWTLCFETRFIYLFKLILLFAVENI